MTTQKKSQLPRLLVGATLLGCLFSSVAFAEIAVITNTGTGVSSLNAKQVKAIFLKKAKTFPDGAAVVPGDQAEGSSIRDDFGKKVLKKKPKQLKAYWSKRVFSGKAMPPTKIGDDAAVKAWIAKTPGSIAYIDAGAVDNTVKVLLKVN